MTGQVHRHACTAHTTISDCSSEQAEVLPTHPLPIITDYLPLVKTTPDTATVVLICFEAAQILDQFRPLLFIIKTTRISLCTRLTL